MLSSRKRVLQLYKQALKIGKNWKTPDEARTISEKQDIIKEVREKFRENKTVTDPSDISNLILRTEKRIVQAEHYGIPYERPEYLPPDTAFNVRSKVGKYSKMSRISQVTGDGTFIIRFLRYYYAATTMPTEILEEVIDSCQDENFFSEFYETVFANPALSNVNVSKSYQLNVLKQFTKGEITQDDIYDKLALVLGSPTTDVSDKCYFNDDGSLLAVFQESNNQLSRGTTGLSIWQASCDLANLLRSVDLSNKVVVELGAGCGVSGIVAASLYPTSIVYLTDYDENVLSQLQTNVNRNSLTNTHVRSLDWEDRQSPVFDEVGQADFILCADVVYDIKLIDPLLTTIKRLFHEKTVALIASTRRSDLVTVLKDRLHRVALKVVECVVVTADRKLIDEPWTTNFPFPSSIQADTVFYNVQLA